MSENDIALGDHEHPIPVTLLCIHVLLENASGGSLCVPQLLLHDNLDIVIQRKHPEDFQRLCITVLQQG